MRIIGIDYGVKKTGIAISDELNLTARPLLAIKRKNNNYFNYLSLTISKILQEYSFQKIILGFPLKSDGTKSIQCNKVETFSFYLKEKIKIPILFWDEYLTTWEANDLMIKAKIKNKKRKRDIDKISAVIILQSYLNTLYIK